MDTRAQHTQSIQTDSPANDTSDGAKSSHPAGKQSAVFADLERGLVENMSNTLEQILDVLRESAIAEERGKDVQSKFWATYKKVSSEYDDDFLERASDDMAIVLTFAGLFSAVNSTFIVGMQPNPGDTTNALMVQLIQVIANGPNAVNDINNLRSSTTYASSTVWTQTLAYASLAFSVLAAFGAVMGKQWINSYKTSRGRGSLEERGLQRQRKLDGLELWQLQNVLGAFLVLLQISLLLFGLSLSASIWTQQITISSVIICTTAFGMIFYLATILVSVLNPDSPFQTPGSVLIDIICKNFLPVRPTSAISICGRSSAVRWILETSTNPEVIEAAAAMVPHVQWSPKVDISAAYRRLIDNFRVSRDRSELYAKAVVHLWTRSVVVNPLFIGLRISSDACNSLIRDAFTAGHHAWSQFQIAGQEGVRRKHMADARTALRTMVIYGRRFCLSLPDDEHLIWNGDLRWSHSDGLAPSCKDFDWLVDYLSKVNGIDDATEGDALLALSAMHALGSSAKRRSYIKVLIHCMGPTRPSRVRHAALRATAEAREELASIANDVMAQGVDAELLDELSRALLTAILPKQKHVRTVRNGGPDAAFHHKRDLYYFRLVFALATNDKWRERLSSHGHVKRCISLADFVLQSPTMDLSLYLVGTLLRIDPSSKDLSLNPFQERWRTLMSRAWIVLGNTGGQEIHGWIDIVPAIVEATRQVFQDSGDGLPNWGPLKVHYIANNVQRALVRLRATVGQADESPRHAALSIVQGLYDDLNRMGRKSIA